MTDEPRYMPYGGAGSLPVDCCDYSVVDGHTGKEVCRCWDLEKAQHIAFVMNNSTSSQSARIDALEAALKVADTLSKCVAINLRLSDVTPDGRKPDDCAIRQITRETLSEYNEARTALNDKTPTDTGPAGE